MNEINEYIRRLIIINYNINNYYTIKFIYYYNFTISNTFTNITNN